MRNTTLNHLLPDFLEQRFKHNNLTPLNLKNIAEADDDDGAVIH